VGLFNVHCGSGGGSRHLLGHKIIFEKLFEDIVLTNGTNIILCFKAG
jgi:hypothetical protein